MKVNIRFWLGKGEEKNVSLSPKSGDGLEGLIILALSDFLSAVKLGKVGKAFVECRLDDGETRDSFRISQCFQCLSELVRTLGLGVSIGPGINEPRITIVTPLFGANGELNLQPLDLRCK